MYLILMALMIDSAVVVEGEIRYQSLLGFKRFNKTAELRYEQKLLSLLTICAFERENFAKRLTFLHQTISTFSSKNPQH